MNVCTLSQIILVLVQIIALAASLLGYGSPYTEIVAMGLVVPIVLLGLFHITVGE